MFKADWEKANVIHQLPEGMVEKMVRLAYPDKKLISRELIAGGCANLNIKIQLEDVPNSLILRVYLRDKEAAAREQKLGMLLEQHVPVPLTYYVGKVDQYHFAITQFMTGITLRDLLLGDLPHDVNSIMHEVGKSLSKITSHTFSMAGFFDKNLNIIYQNTEDDVLTFSKQCLQSENVSYAFELDTISKIKGCLDKFGHLFPDDNEKHLVHGDFDPANILVDQIDGVWKITGILDFEFAFSGSILWDVANMLRYAHKMPLEFKNAFLSGLANGVSLPDNWHITVHLLNLVSLLDLLKRADPPNHPRKCADICTLIDYILHALDKTQTSLFIQVVPYNSDYPNIFEIEAEKIKKTLGDNCIEIHHIGSTSVPNLASKPKIDMIAVVRAFPLLNNQLEASGYIYRGGFNIPFRKTFTLRNAGINVNLHVFEKDDPEIELNVLFRDYLRQHSTAKDEYEAIKYNLLEKDPSHKKNNSVYTGYTLGKHDFIQKILQQCGFNRHRFVLCTYYIEWNAAKYFRQKYFFGPHNIDDPYTWTFDHPQHKHFILYQGIAIIGYVHIQLWADKRAALRIIVIDEEKRNNNHGSHFLSLCEKWLKNIGYKSLHAESAPAALTFYKKNGYAEMSFNDPDGYESGPEDIAVGKEL